MRTFDEFNATPGTPISFHAITFAAQRHYDKAAALIDGANHEPNDPDVLIKRAIFAVDQGKWSEGRELIRRASAAPNLEPTLGHKLHAIDPTQVTETESVSGAYLMHHGLNLNLHGDYDSTSVTIERQP